MPKDWCCLSLDLSCLSLDLWGRVWGPCRAWLSGKTMLLLLASPFLYPLFPLIPPPPPYATSNCLRSKLSFKVKSEGGYLRRPEQWIVKLTTCQTWNPCSDVVTAQCARSGRASIGASTWMVTRSIPTRDAVGWLDHLLSLAYPPQTHKVNIDFFLGILSLLYAPKNSLT